MTGAFRSSRVDERIRWSSQRRSAVESRRVHRTTRSTTLAELPFRLQTIQQARPMARSTDHLRMTIAWTLFSIR